MENFKNFLTEKNDRIDNAAFNLLNELASASLVEGESLEWDMSLIGELVDYAKELLSERGIIPCHPFYEGEKEVECPNGTDCKRTDCPFRKEI